MPFLPDPDSRVSKLVDYVTTQMPNTGDTLAYAELADLIGVEDDGTMEARAVLSGVVADANHRLGGRGDWQYLICIAKFGYRVASLADLHDEATARDARALRQASRALGAVERVVTHPDATSIDKRQASDAAAARGALLARIRTEQASVRGVWKRPETSPVPPDPDDD